MRRAARVCRQLVEHGLMAPDDPEVAPALRTQCGNQSTRQFQCVRVGVTEIAQRLGNRVASRG
jgi:hypothetical protein